MRKEGDLLQGGFPDGWAEKARALLAKQAPDALHVIEGQYRRGLIGAAERAQKVVAAAHALTPERFRALPSPATERP